MVYTRFLNNCNIFEYFPINYFQLTLTFGYYFEFWFELNNIRHSKLPTLKPHLHSGLIINRLTITLRFLKIVAHASRCLRGMDILENHTVRAQRSISRMETALCQVWRFSLYVLCLRHKLKWEAAER